MDDLKLVDNSIIHKKIEPTVITDEIIQECIIEQGHSGEAGRLARMEPIRYKRILVIRLDFMSELFFFVF